SIDTNSSSVALPPCFLSILTSSKPPNEHLPYYNKSPRKMRGLCQQSDGADNPAPFFLYSGSQKHQSAVVSPSRIKHFALSNPLHPTPCATRPEPVDLATAC
ncbi:MAG: hypothetical protein V1784_10550, partial [bacterium]